MKSASIADPVTARWFKLTGDTQRRRISMWWSYPMLRRDLRSEFKNMVRVRLEILRRGSV